MAHRPQITSTPMSGHLPPPHAHRDEFEQKVLACQLAGAHATSAMGPLFRDPLHVRIQAAIEGARADMQLAGPQGIADRLLRDDARDQTDHLDYLRRLEAPFYGSNTLTDSLAEYQDILEGVCRIEDNLPVDLVALSDIENEAVNWVWDGWLARGKLQLLAGPVGVGKTTLALSLAATITAGSTLPDGGRAKSCDVLMWSGEDDAADSLAPRFRACGGDPSRFFLVNGRRERDGEVAPFDPARDLRALSLALATRRDPAHLIIDPIVSAVAGDTDKNAATRRALGPVVALAGAHDIAVLGISHFGKTGQGRDLVNRVSGSQSFGAMARIVLATAKMANGINLLVRAKSNIGPTDGGFAYTLEQVDLAGGIRGQRIAWQGAIEGTPRDLLKETELVSEADAPQRDAARQWLADVLAAGAVAVPELMQKAAAEGHAWRTIRRAKTRLDVRSVRTGDGWSWTIPDSGENTVAKWPPSLESRS